MERKLATVLFVDLVDSTGLVAAADPEVVRGRVNRWFERAARCIEEHGGTVEKFAGDAVMAAFGIPRAHEDDAERAVRAAFAIMAAVHELGLEARAGLEAGEVVVEESDSTFATGEAVNLAARLQQSAAPGTIVLGPVARRLAAGAVEVEDAGPLELKGRAEPIWTWRAVRPRATRLRLPAAPFVGREVELELLRQTYARAVRDRRAHLVTVFGEAGIGKSRLVEEFLAGVERATTLTGRALPYGEGVTYWPLASMIKASAGIGDDDPASEAFEKLRTSCESDAVADLLAAALGVLGAAGGEHAAGELSWAALRWAEQLAEAQPLVLVFEDAQWADERLLEVVAHLARSLLAVPIVLLCVARPDLLDTLPTWGGGNVRALSLDLGPLDEAESHELAEALLARADVPSGQRARLLEKAEGNPLFLEETARMLVEADGAAAGRIPDTVQALIAARIDRLEPEEKRLLQHAALVGRVFWRGALERLAPDLDVGAILETLLERELVLPEELSTISGDRAFHFKHVLIRDVAYATLSKAQRADDHRAFAGWVTERAPDELVEIRAYHLDQAATLLAELGRGPSPELAHEAAAALQEAGGRALRRESFTSARRLLLRALVLEPTHERRFEAARAAWRLGDQPAVAREMRQVADTEADPGLRAQALAALADVTLHQTADPAAAQTIVDEALALLDGEADAAIRFDVLGVAGLVASWEGDLVEVERIAREALALARSVERKDLEAVAIEGLGRATMFRLDVAEAGLLLRRSEELAEESGSARSRAAALELRGWIDAALGNLDETAAAYTEVREIYRELGLVTSVAKLTIYLGKNEFERGDAVAAERELRDAVRTLREVGDRGFLAEALRLLAQALAAQGRLDEAERVALDARETVGPRDRYSYPTTMIALGVVRAGQGRDAEAEALLGDAVADFEASQLRFGLVEALEALEQFLRSRGRDDEADELERQRTDLRSALLRPAAPARG